MTPKALIAIAVGSVPSTGSPKQARMTRGSSEQNNERVRGMKRMERLEAGFKCVSWTMNMANNPVGTTVHDKFFSCLLMVMIVALMRW